MPAAVLTKELVPNASSCIARAVCVEAVGESDQQMTGSDDLVAV